MDLSDIFRTLHPNAEEYTFFSCAHGTFSRIDHIFGHKSNLSKFKKIEIISSIFSDHNTMRRYKLQEKTIRNTNTWRLNNRFKVTNRLLKKARNKWQWKHNSKRMGCCKSSSKREVYSDTTLPQETKKTSNRQSNFSPKTTGKRRTKKLHNQ